MKISDAECIIMEVLWRSGEATADQIVGALNSEQDWKPATVKTLLNRLLTKGAITARQNGRRYIYTASTLRTEYVYEHSRGLINRFFNGRVAPLVSQFSEQEALTREDIIELKRLVERLEDES